MKTFQVYEKCKSCNDDTLTCKLKYIKTVVVDSEQDIKQLISDTQGYILKEVEYLEEEIRQ